MSDSKLHILADGKSFFILRPGYKLPRNFVGKIDCAVFYVPANTV